MAQFVLAIATGRIRDQAIAFLEKAGIYFPDFHNKTRKLVIEDKTKKVKLIFAKTADLGIYVERGAADLGIIGKDIILEEEPDVYELLDFRFGACKLVIAGFPNTTVYNGNPLTIASKYPNITEKHFISKGQMIETIPLNGSIELAPLMGLSDIIVDIVETGTTLKQNGLEILDTIANVTTRLIVNKASYATKREEISTFIQALKRVLEES